MEALLKRGIIIVILIAIITVPVFAQFYTSLSDQERQRLAEAYYLVGLQYKEIGKTEKGEDYIRAAQRIYPQLDPDRINPELVKRGPSVKVYGEWEPTFAAIPQGKAAYNAVIYRFSEFLRGFYLERPDMLWHVLDDRIYAPPIPTGISLDTAMEEIRVYFNNQPISETPPSDIFELDSISAEAVTRNVWQASIRLTQNDPFHLDRFLNPGKQEQQFFFRIEDGTWNLFAAGFLPENVEHIISPRESIKQTLIECLNALVTEQTEKASSFFTDSVYLISTQRRVSRSSLQSVFEEFFKDYDLSRFAAMQVSLDIQESDADFVPGGSYQAYVEFPAVIKDELSFLRRYQGFYFTYDRGEKGWRIAAVF